MFRRRVVREDDRDVVYDDASGTARGTTGTMSQERHVREEAAGAPVRSERYARDGVPVTRDEYVEEARVAPAHAEYVEEQGDTYMASLPARVNTVLFALLTALEALLGLRFALYAFGASNSSSFVRFIKDVSWPFVRPFSSAFRNRTRAQGIIEVNTLLAMGVWLLGFLLLTALINAALPDTSGHYRFGRRHMTHS